MSGYVPDWMEKGHYILLDDAEVLVTSYYHVNETPHITNSDRLIVVFSDDTKMEYDPQRMSALPALNVPDWIEEGKAVEMNSPFDDDDGVILRVVESFWGMKKAGEKTSRTQVSVVGFTPMNLKKFQPVSEKNETKAALIEKSYKKAIEEREDFFTRPKLLGGFTPKL